MKTALLSVVLSAVLTCVIHVSRSAILEKREHDNEVIASKYKRSAENQDREFQTYNVNLLNTVENNKNRTTRRDEIIQAIQGSSADVLCLQEVWYENDMRAILGAVFDKFRFSHSFLHEDAMEMPEPQNVCEVGTNQLRDLAECILINCPADPSTCLFSTCYPLRFLSQRCLECALTSCMGTVRDLAAADVCVQTNIQAGVCHSRISGGHDRRTRGLLLLSKRELRNPEAVKFTYRSGENSSQILLGRGYLKAEIEDTTVVCTHLTSNSKTPFFDFVTGFQEWSSLNSNEMITLFKRLVRGINGPIVFLGDFNNGPSINKAAGEMRGNYKRVVNDGFQSALVAVNKPQCTLCWSNSFVTEDQTGINGMVDHIFVRSSGPLSFIDAKLLVNTMDKDSCQVFGDISDHYGVSATINGTFGN